jgi:hypothetical protein
MPKRIHITTPWPTSEEVAKRLRISKRRQKELNALAEEFVRKLQQAQETSGGKTVEKGKKRKNASAAA